LGVLWDDRETRSQARESNLANVHSVNENHPRLRLHNPIEHLVLQAMSARALQEEKIVCTIVRELFPVILEK
jgi:hypothetical protein